MVNYLIILSPNILYFFIHSAVPTQNNNEISIYTTYIYSHSRIVTGCTCNLQFSSSLVESALVLSSQCLLSKVEICLELGHILHIQWYNHKIFAGVHVYNSIVYMNYIVTNTSTA